MSISPFPGKLLSSGQTKPDLKCEDPRLSPRRRSGSPAARCLTDCCRSSASVPLLTLQLAGREWAPPRFCHQEMSRSVGVRRRSAGLSAPLKSEHECRGPESLCIWDLWRDGGTLRWWIVPCVACCSVLLLHARMTLTLTVCGYDIYCHNGFWRPALGWAFCTKKCWYSFIY